MAPILLAVACGPAQDSRRDDGGGGQGGGAGTGGSGGAGGFGGSGTVDAARGVDGAGGTGGTGDGPLPDAARSDSAIGDSQRRDLGAGGSDGGGGSGGGSGGGGSGGGGGAGGGGYPQAGADCQGGEPTPVRYTTILGDMVGFAAAAGTIGGARGCVYHVTTLADSGNGSLRSALSSAAPLWIVFDVAGEIAFGTTMTVSSNKTVDGRGRRVEFSGQPFRIGTGRSNVVVHEVIFKQGVAMETDAINIFGGSKVWVDHVTFGVYGDGALDVTEGATDVTVSWSKFENHDKVILLSAGPTDTQDVNLRFTMHHNFFLRTGQRHPRLRFGRAHSFNNLVVDWTIDSAASSQLGQLVSEANIYSAGARKSALIATNYGSDPQAGYARSVGDLLLNGATVRENEPAMVFSPAAAYRYTAQTADAALQARIEAQAGWQNVPLP